MYFRLTDAIFYIAVITASLFIIHKMVITIGNVATPAFNQLIDAIAG